MEASEPFISGEERKGLKKKILSADGFPDDGGNYVFVGSCVHADLMRFFSLFVVKIFFFFLTNGQILKFFSNTPAKFLHNNFVLLSYLFTLIHLKSTQTF